MTITIKNADLVAHSVPGLGLALPGETLEAPERLAAELLAAPSKGRPGLPAWVLAGDPASGPDEPPETDREDSEPPRRGRTRPGLKEDEDA